MGHPLAHGTLSPARAHRWPQGCGPLAASSRDGGRGAEQAPTWPGGHASLGGSEHGSHCEVDDASARSGGGMSSSGGGLNGGESGGTAVARDDPRQRRVRLVGGGIRRRGHYFSSLFLMFLSKYFTALQVQ